MVLKILNSHHHQNLLAALQDTDYTCVTKQLFAYMLIVALQIEFRSYCIGCGFKLDLCRITQKDHNQANTNLVPIKPAIIVKHVGVDP